MKSRYATGTGLKAIFMTCLIVATSSTVQAEETGAVMPSIGGYSPVSYFTVGAPERGHADHAVTHGDNVYFLTSAEQVRLFEENPQKYLPRYEQCPYSLTLGHKLPLDPTNFQIVGGYLLLFHLSDDVDGRALWNQSALTEKELLDRADKQYVLLRF